MYEQVFQQALHTLSQEGSPYVSLQWRNIRNESMWTTFYKLYSSPKWFGRFAEGSRRSPKDLPLVQCRERSDVSDGSWQTFWGNPASPRAYLEEVAAYLHVLKKHWRPVSITKLHPHTFNRVDDPWEPRWGNAVQAVRRARTGSRMVVRAQQAHDESLAIDRIVASLLKYQPYIGTMERRDVYDAAAAILRVRDKAHDMILTSILNHRLVVERRDLYDAAAAILRARLSWAERSGADTIGVVRAILERPVTDDELRNAGIFNDAMYQIQSDAHVVIMDTIFKHQQANPEVNPERLGLGRAAAAILLARQAEAERNGADTTVALLAARPVTYPELRNAGLISHGVTAQMYADAPQKAAALKKQKRVAAAQAITGPDVGFFGRWFR